MEALGRIIDEIGIKEAAEQLENFFLYREEQYRKRGLEQHEETLAKQKALRYRWRRNT